MEIGSFTLSSFTVVVISGLLIPVLTGFLTKLVASAQTKSLVALIQSILAGVIATATSPDGTAVFSQALIQNTVLTIAIQLAMYIGVYKPIVDINARALPNVGLA